MAASTDGHFTSLGSFKIKTLSSGRRNTPQLAAGIHAAHILKMPRGLPRGSLPGNLFLTSRCGRFYDRRNRKKCQLLAGRASPATKSRCAGTPNTTASSCYAPTPSTTRRSRLHLQDAATSNWWSSKCRAADSCCAARSPATPRRQRGLRWLCPRSSKKSPEPSSPRNVVPRPFWHSQAVDLQVSRVLLCRKWV